MVIYYNSETKKKCLIGYLKPILSKEDKEMFSDEFLKDLLKTLDGENCDQKDLSTSQIEEMDEGKDND